LVLAQLHARHVDDVAQLPVHLHLVLFHGQVFDEVLATSFKLLLAVLDLLLGLLDFCAELAPLATDENLLVQGLRDVAARLIILDELIALCPLFQANHARVFYA
jgi:hypothetical protein